MPDGSEPRLIEVPARPARRSGALRQWLVVSTVPERLYGEEAIERAIQRLEWVGQRALAHEAVVEHFLGSRALLPMQLFTLFRSDVRALEHVVRSWRRIERLLGRLERRVEWGIRATWNPVASASGNSVRARRQRSGPAGEGTGTAYLVGKRTMRDQSLMLARQAKTDANRLYRIAAAQASESRRRSETETQDGGRLLLDAAFLVARDRARAFRASVRREAAALARRNVAVSLTGPWPAYTFI
jgi:hypothetical protein